jgi:hypothetical protein
MDSYESGVTRRHFVKHMAAASMTVPMLNWLELAQAARSQGKGDKTRSMILVWLGGGPATIDMWDLKPGSKNGGPFKPILTTGAGQICEHLPRIAKQMKHLNIIRSYNSRDGAHERGTYINHTAFAPVASVLHPAIGAVVARFNSPGEMDVPGHISVGGPGVSPGFLGTAFAPFRVNAGPDPIPNLKPPVDSTRFAARAEVLTKSQLAFVSQNRGPLPKDQQTIYAKAFRLMSANVLDAFRIEKEDPKTRSRYGEHEFGRRCLLARRLVEAGVPFVEVGYPGSWDHHQGIFNILAGGGGRGGMQQPFLPTLDQGFAALVEDLVGRGLLATTCIICMGEFGRTPRINQDQGRDHWPGSWSVVLGGGGMKGGEVVGKTDPDGVAIVDRPVEVSNLFATLYKAVKIEPATELRSPNGRPIKLVGVFGDGKPVDELF